MPRSSQPRPEIAFDLDGVISAPFLGMNLALRRRAITSPLPPTITEQPPLDDLSRARRLLAVAWKVLPFVGRRPLPDAAAGLAAISEVARPILVTQRSIYGQHHLEQWLERHDLRRYFHAVLPNTTTLDGPHYKLWQLQGRGAFLCVDDDGATAQYLASDGFRTVFLRDWPANRGLDYPSNVAIIRSLEEITPQLAAAAKAA